MKPLHCCICRHKQPLLSLPYEEEKVMATLFKGFQTGAAIHHHESLLRNKHEVRLDSYNSKVRDSGYGELTQDLVSRFGSNVSQSFGVPDMTFNSSDSTINDGGFLNLHVCAHHHKRLSQCERIPRFDIDYLLALFSYLYSLGSYSVSNEFIKEQQLISGSSEASVGELEKVKREMKSMETALLGAAKQAQAKANEVAKLMNENEQLKSLLEDQMVGGHLYCLKFLKLRFSFVVLIFFWANCK
ncbi:hypothetical protein L1887_31794 [Cichorium endivia]|nr:hypothetical protein L1887_31794 [Cichorium endivia]